MAELEFTRIGKMNKAEFLFGDSAEDLLKKLREIMLPCEIISIYSQGNKHYAWFYTDAKIKKTLKGVK